MDKISFAEKKQRFNDFKFALGVICNQIQQERYIKELTSKPSLNALSLLAQIDLNEQIFQVCQTVFQSKFDAINANHMLINIGGPEIAIHDTYFANDKPATAIAVTRYGAGFPYNYVLIMGKGETNSSVRLEIMPLVSMPHKFEIFTFED